jgi:hypothetical protein
MSRPSVIADPLAPLAGADGTAPGALRVDAPDVQGLGDGLTFTWAGHGVSLAFDQLRDHSDGPHGEILVTSTPLGELHWSRLSLASAPAREGLVRKLEKVLPAAPWRGMLDRACRAVALAMRKGEPIVALKPLRAGESRHLVPCFLLHGETNLIFGDGGSGKSLLAEMIAAAVAAGGIPLACGLTPTATCPALILDWETCREEHEDRLAAIAAGLGRPGLAGLFYRPMARALADDGSVLRHEIARLGVGLVVVDSFGPACGAEPESADSAIRCMNALRSLGPGVTRLVIAHVSKLAAEQRAGPVKPYGSVYVQNLARNVWEIRRGETDGDDLVLGAFHRKVNRGRLLPPFGLRFEFADGAIRLRPHDVGETADLLARTSVAYRIQKALTSGALDAEALADETGAGKDTVKRTLRRLGTQGRVIRVDATHWGLAR